MLLDVKTSHPEIRIQAKNLECEEELNIIQNKILQSKGTYNNPMINNKIFSFKLMK